MTGVAPSASAAGTLASEAGIATETLQRFLARNAGVAEGRLTKKGAKEMRAAFAKTILVVDEGSLASTVQARDLLRIANELRIPRVVLVGDARQLDAVDAGKPFAQLQAAGMKTAVMDEILRQPRSRAETGGRGEPPGRDCARLREAREQCGRGEAGQHRRRGGGKMARALAGGARADRRDGDEPRAAPADQRACPRAAGARGPHPRTRPGLRTAGLEGLHRA